MRIGPEFDTEKASEEQLKRVEHLIDQFNEEEMNDLNPDDQLKMIIKVMEEAVSRRY